MRSIITFPDDYIILDIETTGFSWENDRIIEIAAVLYKNGSKTDIFHTLVNPQIPIPQTVTNLTGITQVDITGAPTLKEIKDQFISFISDYTIIGHNLRTFDIPFINTQMRVSIANPLVDTLDLSRNVFDELSCHKLSYLCEVLRLQNAGSHRAINDVDTTHQLYLACQKPQEYNHFVADEVKRNNAQKHAKKKKAGFSPRIDVRTISPTNNCGERTGPLCGKVIVFTGTLTIPREQAMQLAVDAGAILKSSVTMKTAYLVVGSQDKSLVGDDGLSTKEEKALALNASGKANIQFISEEEFLKLAGKEGAAV